jgi:putative membrane protein
VTEPALAWHAHPDVWAMIAALAGGYLLALRVWGPRHAPGRQPATTRHKACFFLGVGVLWIGSEWPVHQLSEQLFSVHMVQHMLFSLVAAPLLILGTPGWLFRRLFRRPAVFAVVRFLTQPLIALLVFNGWVAAYHWPALVNLSVTNHVAHFAVHVVWVGTAMIMWWPVLSPLPELPHLSYPGRGAYLFAQSIVPTVPASFLTFSHTALYAAYDVVPRLWGVPLLDDQQWAGLLMKIGGGLILWGVIAVLFFRWASEEETGGPDLLYWRDIEPELDATARVGDR